jgi:putative ABC transport system permease protein
MSEIWRRLVALLRRDAAERELTEEMRLHREMKERDLVADGSDASDARYAASRAFGNMTSLSEQSREAWGWRWLEDLAGDCAFAVRGLRKNPAYAATAIVTLILGIGATTAIFSVVNTVLLRPLPYADPARLVRIEENHDGATNFSYANYLDLRATRLNSVERLAAYRPWTFNVSGGSEPTQAEGAMISANFFDSLGVMPELGRGFLDDEEREGADNVAVLSNALWEQQFGGDQAILGKKIRVSDEPHVVVGVMPAGFEFPQGARIYTPLAIGAEIQKNRRSHLLHLVGRLTANATLSQAGAELQSFAGGVMQQNPGVDTGFQVAVGSLHERLTAPVRPALLVLLGAVGLVLLAACANVANLVLMRNTMRAREFAVRAALGAAHDRLLRQCLAESVVLGLAGAAGGVLVAIWSVKLIVAFGPEGVPRLKEAHVDGIVLLFATGLSLLTAMIFGAVPAVEASRTDPNKALQEEARGASSRHGVTLRGPLVIAEVALALMLLAGSGLLINSFVRLSHVWPGYDESNLLTANLFLSPMRYPDNRIGPFFEQMLDRVRAIPGVESAAVVNTLPLARGAATDFVIEGQPAPPPGNEPSADIRMIAGDYFSTMRIPLLRGRWFDARDNESSPKVMVVNRQMAERYWPGENPVGKRLTMMDWGPPLTGEVVGVVGDVKADSLDTPIGFTIYWPERQFPSIFDNLVIRTSRDPSQMASTVKSIVHSFDPDLPVANIATMQERLATSVRPHRVQTVLLGVFALLALSMAVVGIYGVMAYSVSRRRREIGIRMALGADGRAVRSLVLRQGLRWAALGAVLGLVGALALAGVLSTLLYGVSPRDPATYGGVTLLLLFVAMIACYLPAQRAARLDAIRTLRSD